MPANARKEVVAEGEVVLYLGTVTTARCKPSVGWLRSGHERATRT